MQAEERKKKRTTTKVKKGWLAVEVGLDDVDGGSQRFVMPISYLHHPQFRRLLEQAEEAYGYSSSPGPLKLPCSIDDFLHLRWLIEREYSGLDSVDDHRPGHLSPFSYNFLSCQIKPVGGARKA